MCMKRLILCFLLLFFIISLKSEVLYGTGTRWIITGKMYNENEYKSYAEFEVLGDTVVDGILYRKIYMKNSGKKSFLAAVIRETFDSLIYVRTFDLENHTQELSEENLLYDFSLWDKGIIRLSECNFNRDDTYIDNITIEKKYLSITKFVDGTEVSSYNWNGYTILRGIGCVDSWGPLLWLNTLSYAPSASPIPSLYRFYRNGKLLYENIMFTPTGLNAIFDKNISITPTDGGCLVTLGSDAVEWTATLHNSNGVTVAQQQGNGSEIFLPTESKGTHILVVKAGGKVVKKKIYLR